MGAYVPAAGIYRLNDYTPLTDAATVGGVPGNALIDGVLYTAVDGLNWDEADGYGVDLGSPKAVDVFDCYAYIASSINPTDWNSSYSQFGIYGSDDNLNWTLIESFTGPPIIDHATHQIHFRITLTSTSNPYRYFLVHAASQIRVREGGNARQIQASEIIVARSDSVNPDNLSLLTQLGTSTIEQVNCFPDDLDIKTSVSAVDILFDVQPTDLRIPVKIKGKTWNDEINISTDYIAPTGNGIVNWGSFSCSAFAGAFGSVEFPEFVITSTGLSSLIGNGKVTFSEFNCSAEGPVEGKLKFHFSVSSTGSVGILSSGKIKFPDFNIKAISTSIFSKDGKVIFPGFSLNATGYSGVIGNGVIKFSTFKLSSSSVTALTGSAKVKFDFTIKATGYIQSSGIGLIKFPDFNMHSYSEIVNLSISDEILKHHRTRRFID